MIDYDPVPYWQAQGPYLAGPGGVTPEHRRQEAALRDLLGPLEWDSVLEIGCGGGRITSLLHDLRPTARYTGLDVGQIQLDAGARAWPGGEFVLSPVEDFDPAGRTWDLVITSEVLMHVVPEHVGRAIRTLLEAAARSLVIVEWVPTAAELEQPIASWNFPHDYLGMLGPVAHAERVDRQAIYLVER